jgi:hypothetical protein
LGNCHQSHLPSSSDFNTNGEWLTRTQRIAVSILLVTAMMIITAIWPEQLGFLAVLPLTGIAMYWFCRQI